ncbi:MAG: site-specific DNA-methyltransferase [Actinomycetes bacterium]
MEHDLQVETVAIADLKTDPNNARKHGTRNLEAIKGSLTTFGQRRALIVRQDGTVIAGNGTLEAARALGWSEVAVTRVPADWTDEQAKAYALADNRTAELATWDDLVLAGQLTDLSEMGFDLNAIGFDGLPTLDGAAEDVPPVPIEPVARPGDLWQLGDHRLLCGSSTDAANVVRLFGDDRAAAVITDPPYGISYESRGRKGPARPIANDAASGDVLSSLVSDALRLGCEFTAGGGALYCFHADVNRGLFEEAAREAGWFIHETLIWVKQSITLSWMDYQPQHEPCLYGWKAGKGRHGWYGGRKRSAIVGDQAPDIEGLSLEAAHALLHAIYEDTTVVRHDRPSRSDEHPTMKPVGLIARFIVNSTKPGGLVYDPFLGSGTTLIAAHEQKRICYGMELDPGYCDVIVRRWENLTGEKATLADAP